MSAPTPDDVAASILQMCRDAGFEPTGFAEKVYLAVARKAGATPRLRRHRPREPKRNLGTLEPGGYRPPPGTLEIFLMGKRGLRG